MLAAMTQTTPNTLAGQVALVTGANTGIGRVTARELARRGAHVFIACRSAQRAQPVVDEIRAATGSVTVELLSLDLGDLASVRACAQAFLARELPLHLLINNAGIAGAKGSSTSGFVGPRRLNARSCCATRVARWDAARTSSRSANGVCMEEPPDPSWTGLRAR